MIIRNVRWDPEGRLEAEVLFETSGQSRRIWFVSTDTHLSPIFPVHPFVAAAYLPAIMQGEERIVVQESLDPSFVANIEVVNAYAATWWKKTWGVVPPIIVEGTQLSSVTIPADRSAVCFFTGGLDSLYTLHKNLQVFPVGHPWRISKAVFCYGLDTGLGGMNYESGAEKRKFAELHAVLGNYLNSVGVKPILVDTNVRTLNQDNDLYVRNFHGSYLASVAHFLSGVGRLFYIGSTLDVPNLIPWGSHPDIDENFSDVAVSIRHDGIEASRIKKIQRLIGWGVDLDVLHVCFVNPLGKLNCGACKKCRRSIVELLAVGAEDQAQRLFDKDSVSNAIMDVTVGSFLDYVFLSDASDAFAQRGREQEASILSRKLAAYSASRRRVEERDWRGPIKKILRRVGLRR